MVPTCKESCNDLPPELKRAAERAVRLTDHLTPPVGYDHAYWREERTAIAQMAVWQAVQAYQPVRGVSREVYATLRAEWAILDEYKRLQRTGWCLVSLPVDAETGEVIELADSEAQEVVEVHALYAQVREAVQSLPAAERRVLILHFDRGLSERAIARLLGVSKSWVHRRLQAAIAQLQERLVGGARNSESKPMG